MTIILILSLFLLFLTMGMPIAFSMGVSALLTLLFIGNVPLAIMVQRLYSGADSWSLLAIPFFLLAGELMTAGVLTRQLVRFTAAYFRYFPAGTGTVDIISSMLFAGVSGSGTADMAAVGSVLIPRLIARGYPRGLAAAIEATSGAIGPIIPPSMFMIIYAGIAEVSVGRMFLGGIIPGLLIGIGLIIVLQIWNSRRKFEPREPMTSLPDAIKEMAASTIGGIAALIMPLIIVGGIVSGAFTATESGAVAAVYALTIGLAMRALNVSDVIKCFVGSTATTVRIMFPVAAAVLFGWILAREQFALIATDFIVKLSGGHAWIGAILVMITLVILGFPIEGMTLLIVFTPILAPMGSAMGFDPIHWGVLLVLSINLAGITPPVGGCLYLVSGIAHARYEDTIHYLWPFLGVMVIVIFVVLFIPQTVLFIPDLLMSTK